MNVLLERFDESADDDLIRPVDDAGNLDELVKSGTAEPEIVDAAVGFGRKFVSADGDGYIALDKVAGSTLLTRDASIQAIMSWDIVAAAAYGFPQTIYARGKGTSAAEYCGACIQLTVVNASLRIGQIRWLWHDLAGVLKTQVGGHFQLPPTGFVMFTATRRWVNSTRVVLRYYLGDALLIEVESVDGSIGGGTTGTTQIGTRWNAAGAAYGFFLSGVIDELRVVDEELTAEEIAATYRRITIEQPRGYQLVREMHDPGFPISQDPGSRAQRETRLWGHALGYAAAQGENIRENILPDRAYGRVLTRWEQITKQAARAGDSVDKRRERVVGRIRQKRGVSIPGVGDALTDLLVTDPGNLQIIAFDQTTLDQWTTLNTTRWRHDPSAQWTIASNALRVQSAGDRSVYADWYTSLMAVGGDGRRSAILSKIIPTTIADQGEVGVILINRATNTAALLGYRNDVGTYKIVRSEVVNGIIGASTFLDSTSGLVNIWLLLEQHPDTPGSFRARWSQISGDGPFSSAAFTISSLTGFQWAGFYARTYSATAATIDVSLDDTEVRAPYGERSFIFYVYRPTALGGEPDVLGADTVLQGLKQAHTFGCVVETLTALCDDPLTTCDCQPMGAV